MDSDEWVKRYSNERPKYVDYTNKLTDLVSGLLDYNNIEAIIEKRTKSIESFKKKIEMPEKNYNNPLTEITDLTGIRLILKNLNVVDEVVKLIEDNFEIDYDNSVDKADDLEYDRFGYLSIHLIFRLKKPRSELPEWSNLKHLWAEIQIRTVIQHAWASISHFLDYKNELDVPSNLKRDLYCISAVLELADNNLNSLVNDIITLSEQYKQNIRSQNLDMEINKTSLTIYLDDSDVFNFWVEICESLGIRVINVGVDDSSDIELLNFVNLNTIQELDDVLENSKSWGKDYLNEFFMSIKSQIIDGVASILVLRALIIGNFIEKFDKYNSSQFRFEYKKYFKLTEKYGPKNIK